MDAYNSNLRSMVLDPNRDSGISNALWLASVGTPGVTGSSPAVKFRFSEAEGLVRADVVFGRFEILINVPTPEADQDKQFGLKNLAMGDRGKIFVLIDDDVVTFNTYDNAGVVETTTIQWLSDWDGVETKFVIQWFSDRVLFSYEDGDGVEQVLAMHKTRVGNLPLNFYVRNDDSDNLDVAYILFDRVKLNSIILV